jgi:hypothetical protein
MQSFYYRPGRNAATALISAPMAALAGWQWWSDGDILWMTSTMVFGLAALKGALNSVNSEPALKFDRDRLWVRTTFGSRVLTWQQVYGIALQVMTVRYWGIVPIRRVESLCIAYEGGAIGAKRLRIPASTIELPIGGAQALVQILRDAQLTAVGQTGVAMAGAGQTGWGAPTKAPQSVSTPESAFDPDAAIARYLASKETIQNAPAADQVQAPAVSSALTPQRPVFGRRQASN